MYVTVIVLDEVVNRVDSESDTEDVFEEAEEEFSVNAPLARPEEVGLPGNGQKDAALNLPIPRPEKASFLESSSAVVHSSLLRKEVDSFGRVKKEAYAINSFLPKPEKTIQKPEKANLRGRSPALLQRPEHGTEEVQQVKSSVVEELGEYSEMTHEILVLINLCTLISNMYEPRHKKTTFWFPTWSNTNQAVQLLKTARGLKFRF